MEENKYTLKDLVVFGAQQKPIEFNQAFNELITDRLRSAVDDKKLELARSIFNNAPEEQG